MPDEDECDCGNHEEEEEKQTNYKKIAIGVSIFIAVVGVVIFVIWLFLQPTNPVFVLQGVTAGTLNLTGSPPNFLTSTFQLTVQSHNPMAYVSIYYDSLIVYASYLSEPITPSLSILPNPAFQDTGGVVVWSPIVEGVLVPIAPFIGEALNQDVSSGVLRMNIKMDGRVRFKVGAFISATYRLNVDCPAYVSAGSPQSGIAQRCSVSV